MTDAENPRAVIGGNNPPLAEVLAEHAKPLLQRLDELEAAVKRSIPDVIDSDGLDGKATVFGVMAAELAAELVETHKTEKAPFLESGKTVDSFFRGPIERVRAVKDDLATRLARYKDGKAEAARAAQRKIAEESRAAAEKERQRQEAERRRNTPSVDASGEGLDQALAASRPARPSIDMAAAHDRRADDAEAAAAAPLADLTRNRDKATGALSTAKQKMTFTIEDIAKIPLAQLRSNFKREHIEAAVRQYVANGGTELKGVKIFPETKVTFRR